MLLGDLGLAGEPLEESVLIHAQHGCEQSHFQRTQENVSLSDEEVVVSWLLCVEDLHLNRDDLQAETDDDPERENCHVGDYLAGVVLEALLDEVRDVLREDQALIDEPRHEQHEDEIQNDLSVLGVLVIKLDAAGEVRVNTNLRSHHNRQVDGQRDGARPNECFHLQGLQVGSRVSR